MPDTGEHVVKRKMEFFYSSSEESFEDFDSDDSVNDKDYIEREDDSSLSSNDSETVSLNCLWLVPFLDKKRWLIFC